MCTSTSSIPIQICCICIHLLCLHVLHVLRVACVACIASHWHRHFVVSDFADFGVFRSHFVPTSSSWGERFVQPFVREWDSRFVKRFGIFLASNFKHLVVSQKMSEAVWRFWSPGISPVILPWSCCGAAFLNGLIMNLTQRTWLITANIFFYHKTYFGSGNWVFRSFPCSSLCYEYGECVGQCLW